MHTHGSPRVQFQPNGTLKALRCRADTESDAALAQVAQRDLERYYETLRYSVPWLERSEWLLIFDATCGMIADRRTVPFLWASLRAVREDYALKWGVDRRALLAKFRRFTYAEAMSVADAAERFWSHPRGNMDHPDEALRDLGVMAPDHTAKRTEERLLAIQA